MPCDINVSAFYNARQGYPWRARSRRRRAINGAPQVDILLDPIGEERLPNYQNVDFHVERPFKVGTVRFIPSMDVFNVGNYEHDSGNPRPAERGEREPNPGDSGAARRPFRRARELVRLRVLGLES